MTLGLYDEPNSWDLFFGDFLSVLRAFLLPLGMSFSLDVFCAQKFCSIIQLGKAQDYWQHTESKCGLKKMKDLWIYNSTYDGPAFHLQILEQNMRFESCE